MHQQLRCDRARESTRLLLEQAKVIDGLARGDLAGAPIAAACTEVVNGAGGLARDVMSSLQGETVVKTAARRVLPRLSTFRASLMRLDARGNEEVEGPTRIALRNGTSEALKVASPFEAAFFNVLYQARLADNSHALTRSMMQWTLRLVGVAGQSAGVIDEYASLLRSSATHVIASVQATMQSQDSEVRQQLATTCGTMIKTIDTIVGLCKEENILDQVIDPRHPLAVSVRIIYVCACRLTHRHVLWRLHAGGSKLLKAASDVCDLIELGNAKFANTFQQQKINTYGVSLRSHCDQLRMSLDSLSNVYGALAAEERFPGEVQGVLEPVVYFINSMKQVAGALAYGPKLQTMIDGVANGIKAVVVSLRVLRAAKESEALTDTDAVTTAIGRAAQGYARSLRQGSMEEAQTRLTSELQKPVRAAVTVGQLVLDALAPANAAQLPSLAGQITRAMTNLQQVNTAGASPVLAAGIGRLQHGLYALLTAAGVAQAGYDDAQATSMVHVALGTVGDAVLHLDAASGNAGLIEPATAATIADTWAPLAGDDDEDATVDALGYFDGVMPAHDPGAPLTNAMLCRDVVAAAVAINGVQDNAAFLTTALAQLTNGVRFMGLMCSPTVDGTVSLRTIVVMAYGLALNARRMAADFTNPKGRAAVNASFQRLTEYVDSITATSSTAAAAAAAEAAPTQHAPSRVSVAYVEEDDAPAPVTTSTRSPVVAAPPAAPIFRTTPGATADALREAVRVVLELTASLAEMKSEPRGPGPVAGDASLAPKTWAALENHAGKLGASIKALITAGQTSHVDKLATDVGAACAALGLAAQAVVRLTTDCAVQQQMVAWILGAVESALCVLWSVDASAPTVVLEPMGVAIAVHSLLFQFSALTTAANLSVSPASTSGLQEAAASFPAPSPAVMTSQRANEATPLVPASDARRLLVRLAERLTITTLRTAFRVLSEGRANTSALSETCWLFLRILATGEHAANAERTGALGTQLSTGVERLLKAVVGASTGGNLRSDSLLTQLAEGVTAVGAAVGEGVCMGVGTATFELCARLIQGAAVADVSALMRARALLEDQVTTEKSFLGLPFHLWADQWLTTLEGIARIMTLASVRITDTPQFLLSQFRAFTGIIAHFVVATRALAGCAQLEPNGVILSFGKNNVPSLLTAALALEVIAADNTQHSQRTRATAAMRAAAEILRVSARLFPHDMDLGDAHERNARLVGWATPQELGVPPYVQYVQAMRNRIPITPRLLSWSSKEWLVELETSTVESILACGALGRLIKNLLNSTGPSDMLSVTIAVLGSKLSRTFVAAMGVACTEADMSPGIAEWSLTLLTTFGQFSEARKALTTDGSPTAWQTLSLRLAMLGRNLDLPGEPSNKRTEAIADFKKASKELIGSYTTTSLVEADRRIRELGGCVKGVVTASYTGIHQRVVDATYAACAAVQGIKHALHGATGCIRTEGPHADAMCETINHAVAALAQSAVALVKAVQGLPQPPPQSGWQSMLTAHLGTMASATSTVQHLFSLDREIAALQEQSKVAAHASSDPAAGALLGSMAAVADSVVGAMAVVRPARQNHTASASEALRTAMKAVNARVEELTIECANVRGSGNDLLEAGNGIASAVGTLVTVSHTIADGRTTFWSVTCILQNALRDAAADIKKAVAAVTSGPGGGDDEVLNSMLSQLQAGSGRPAAAPASKQAAPEPQPVVLGSDLDLNGLFAWCDVTASARESRVDSTMDDVFAWAEPKLTRATTSEDVDLEELTGGATPPAKPTSTEPAPATTPAPLVAAAPIVATAAITVQATATKSDSIAVPSGDGNTTEQQVRADRPQSVAVARIDHAVVAQLASERQSGAQPVPTAATTGSGPAPTERVQVESNQPAVAASPPASAATALMQRKGSGAGVLDTRRASSSSPTRERSDSTQLNILDALLADLGGDEGSGGEPGSPMSPMPPGEGTSSPSAVPAHMKRGRSNSISSGKRRTTASALSLVQGDDSTSSLDNLLTFLKDDIAESATAAPVGAAVEPAVAAEVQEADEAENDLDSLLLNLSTSAPPVVRRSEVASSGADDQLDSLLAELHKGDGDSRGTSKRASTALPASAAVVAPAPAPVASMDASMDATLSDLLAELGSPAPAPAPAAAPAAAGANSGGGGAPVTDPVADGGMSHLLGDIDEFSKASAHTGQIVPAEIDALAAAVRLLETEADDLARSGAGDDALRAALTAMRHGMEPFESARKQYMAQSSNAQVGERLLQTRKEVLRARVVLESEVEKANAQNAASMQRRPTVMRRKEKDTARKTVALAENVVIHPSASAEAVNNAHKALNAATDGVAGVIAKKPLHHDGLVSATRKLVAAADAFSALLDDLELPSKDTARLRESLDVAQDGLSSGVAALVAATKRALIDPEDATVMRNADQALARLRTNATETHTLASRAITSGAVLPVVMPAGSQPPGSTTTAAPAPSAVSTAPAAPPTAPSTAAPAPAAAPTGDNDLGGGVTQLLATAARLEALAREPSSDPAPVFKLTTDTVTASNAVCAAAEEYLMKHNSPASRDAVDALEQAAADLVAATKTMLVQNDAPSRAAVQSAAGNVEAAARQLQVALAPVAIPEKLRASLQAQCAAVEAVVGQINRQDGGEITRTTQSVVNALHDLTANCDTLLERTKVAGGDAHKVLTTNVDILREAASGLVRTCRKLAKSVTDAPTLTQFNEILASVTRSTGVLLQQVSWLPTAAEDEAPPLPARKAKPAPAAAPVAKTYRAKLHGTPEYRELAQTILNALPVIEQVDLADPSKAMAAVRGSIAAMQSMQDLVDQAVTSRPALDAQTIDILETTQERISATVSQVLASFKTLVAAGNAKEEGDSLRALKNCLREVEAALQ